MVNHFFDRVRILAKKFNKSTDRLLEEIKSWYNGYSWDGQNYVYNPYSILSFFRAEKIRNYWFSSGTPTFLLEMIKDQNLEVTSLESYRVGEAMFESFEIDNMDVYALLFQTGYLTIKAVLDNGLYVIAYPNLEVKKSFVEHLLASFSSRFAREVGVMTHDLRKSLENVDMDSFIKIASSIFSGISYDMFVKDREGYYQTVITLIVKLIGINIETEVETNKGRIDAVIKTGDYIYVMEFKLGDAETALAQIKENKYHERYLADGKEVRIVGIGFDPEERNISGYLMETVS